MKSPKKETRVREVILFVAVLFGAAALLRIILAGYEAPWTGFGEYVLPKSEYMREKTLWDWMELLIIPLFLAGGAFVLQRSERAAERNAAVDQEKLEREIAADRQQEAALQAYLDRMAKLLLDEQLQPDKSEKARNVMRVRTLTVLRSLDAKRKGFVMLFLKESGLINRKAVISLMGADLMGAELSFLDLSSTDLSKADLRGANLSGARLIRSNLRAARLSQANLRGTVLDEADLFGATCTEADLSGAQLRKANLNAAQIADARLVGTQLREASLRHTNLSRANLDQANLVKANLSRANLREAILSRADLRETELRTASLRGADLRKANLTDAAVEEAQLAKVKSLDGATMPDGTNHN
jgi:uncharacterized protein YjbI with pentapeptide repeats